MSEKNDNLHAGHRQRVRKRFIEHGFEGFEPHEILEMVLFYAIPRKDTNLLAHKLLERYGTFAKVCDAPVDVLQRDFGLTESAAVLLKMLPPLSSVYVSSHNDAEYIDRKVAVMREEGVTFITNTNIGADVTAEELLRDYDRVLLACGASHPRDINVKGRSAEGVYFAVDFLKSTTKALLDNG